MGQTPQERAELPQTPKDSSKMARALEARFDGNTVRTWMVAVATSVADEGDALGALDAAIGDGDHSTNLERGFEAVVHALAADPDARPGRLLILAGRTLVSTVGGASGPLWGTALRRAGRQLGDETVVDATDVADALEAALAAVVELGSAAVGDKTMVDALDPAVRTLRERVMAGEPLDRALAAAADAAEAGAESTASLQARKGRASYLGERSLGHKDPGAASTALIVRALARTVAERFSG